MTVTPFQLAMLTTYSKPAWQSPGDIHYGDDFENGRIYIDLAKRLERAKFTFLFFEDFNAISRTFGGTIDADLRTTVNSPKYSVLPLAAMLSSHTTHLGLIATASTSFHPPFLLARLLASINNLCEGRFGWNIVTSANDAEAQNYGMDKLPPGPERYARAEEYFQLVDQLLNSWEPGAIIRDEATRSYTDPGKVHEINFTGKYFRSRGPLTGHAGPGGGPVYVQAGASDEGRNFAAKHAEVIFASAGQGVDMMKDYRNDIHRRMKTFGRDPREVKIFYDSDIVITRPGESAVPDYDGPNGMFDAIQTAYSFWMNVDLSQFDPDKPFPADYPTTGITTYLEELKYLGKEQGLTYKEALLYAWNASASGGTHGTVEQVGETMIEMINEVGGDGFMMRCGWNSDGEWSRRIAEELVPYLQDRGAVRRDYAGTTLRENLSSWG